MKFDKNVCYEVLALTPRYIAMKPRITMAIAVKMLISDCMLPLLKLYQDLEMSLKLVVSPNLVQHMKFQLAA